MHGHSPESVLLVNAEVDSMGGVIHGGVGIDNKTSPRLAAISKAQAELRQEYDVREERRRELEFLEKGGNPLDFKLVTATSVSVQSTSVTDQFVTSEAKGSFALTASPHGDSVESSGGPGSASARETNTADNLLLFDGENDTEGDRTSSHLGRSNISKSEQLPHLDGCRNIKESEDSGVMRFVKNQASYARRNRSRSGRDGMRISSTELASAGGGNGSVVLPSSRHSSRDAKGSLCETNTQKGRIVNSNCKTKSTSPNRNVALKTVDKGLDVSHAHATLSGLGKGDERNSDATTSKELCDREQNQHTQGDAEQVHNKASRTPGLVQMKEEKVTSAHDCMPCVSVSKMENLSSGDQPNGFSTSNGDVRDTPKDGQNGDRACKRKDSVDSESSNIQVSLRLDGSTASDQQPNLRKTLSHANSRKHASIVEVTADAEAPDVVKVDNGTKAVEVLAESNDCAPVCMDAKSSGSCLKGEDKDNESSVKNEVKPITDLERLDGKEHIVSNEEGKLDNLSSDNPNVKKAGFHTQDRAHSDGVLQEVDLSGRGSVAVSEPQICKESQIKLVNKAHEDSILEEARSIEAKRKRIAELSVGRLPVVYRRKSHWDFVLEEMAWLANDFRQERLWKKAAAAQVSHSVALNVRSRVDKQNLLRKQRNVAHTLAKAVMEFWCSAEMLLNSDDVGLSLQKVDEGKAVDDRIRDTDMDMSVDIEEKTTGKSSHRSVQGYAVRFLQHSSSLDCPILAEAPVTPDSVSDSVTVDMSWTDQFVEETLFYKVPPGAMEVYRKSVEEFWSQYEKTGGNVYQEEVETSIYDAVSGFGSRENAFEEDEREAGAYYLPGAFEGRNSPKFAQKKRKNLPKAYSRSHEVGAGSPYSRFPENKMGTHSMFQGKRPSNRLDVGPIPTKRVRTAARPRVVSPYGSGAPGGMQMPSKTDASSGDTNSFQDDQSTAQGGSQIRRMDVESTGEYGKQLPLDYTEVSMKLKKKKKTKHPLYKNSLNSIETGGFVTGKGSAYEQRWQHDSVPNEQRDYSKKRDTHAFESNGNNGLFVQQAAKRPKINKQLQDTSPESIVPVNGSIPSPATSQMSNMSSPSKGVVKIFPGRDRGRKSKNLKMTVGQSGSGSAWTLCEDQALVVLVHDMGPNWELISDAINSTLQFKCIYRKAKECKERHKILMDRNAGDGADSAEDSGSSQPYPSTLPGIPKGSARQLFQRLQGPMEEDTLKSHFEKIIFIGQKLNYRRSQGPKQIVQVHSSHLAALSQVCPNNLNGVTLTPRDLCEATSSSSDVLPHVYQGSNPGGVAISNQGPGTSVLPTSGTNSVVQGPSSMALSNSLPSPSTATNASTRDGQRYGAPRASSLPIDEHQKLQQYTQMLSGRNIQQSSLPSPGSITSDRGVRVLPGGNGIGMVSGMNRGMPMPRPGYQGIGPPAVLNMVSSGGMLSTSGVGMPNPANMHNGAVPGHGSTMIRTHEGLHMMRNPDDQRQIMMQELQMQVTQGNSQGIPPYNGLSAGYPNQPTSVQTFPAQQQQQHQMPPQQSHILGNPHQTRLQGGNHATTPQQQAMMSRLAKERQRMMHQHHHQQNQFVASNSSMPHAQSHSQHPTSSLQNSSQIQQQASSQAMSLPSPNAQHPLAPASPMNPTPSQSQQKQHILPHHGLGRNPQAGGGNLPNPMLKQRQRQQQQLQQPGRHHPQQRQQPSQQQAKVMKGVGRVNMITHQNISIDPSQVNGVAVAPGTQIPEKGEQAMHMMHGQGLYSGSGSNPIQSGKSSLVPPQSSNQCSPQHKLFSHSSSPSSKPLSQMASHADNNHQGQIPAVSSAHSLLASQQPVLPLGASSSQHQQRQTGQSQQAVHRMLQQNHPVTSDPPSVQSSVDHIQDNQLSVNGTFQTGTSTSIAQSSSEATSVVPVTSSCTQWKSQEPIYDRGIPNSASHLATAGNQPSPSSVGNDLASLPSQGLTQRPFSGNVVNHAHKQWQSQTQQQKQPTQSSSSSQKQKQLSAPVQHPPPPSLQMQQEQPQQQHLQAGEDALYDRTTDS